MLSPWRWSRGSKPVGPITQITILSAVLEDCWMTLLLPVVPSLQLSGLECCRHFSFRPCVLHMMCENWVQGMPPLRAVSNCAHNNISRQVRGVALRSSALVSQCFHCSKHFWSPSSDMLFRMVAICNISEYEQRLQSVALQSGLPFRKQPKVALNQIWIWWLVQFRYPFYYWPLNSRLKMFHERGTVLTQDPSIRTNVRFHPTTSLTQTSQHYFSTLFKKLKANNAPW